MTKIEEEKLLDQIAELSEKLSRADVLQEGRYLWIPEDEFEKLRLEGEEYARHTRTEQC